MPSPSLPPHRSSRGSGLLPWLCAASVILCANASAQPKASKSPEARVTYEWQESASLKGRSVILTGRQLLDPVSGKESTHYFDAQGRALSPKFTNSRQKRWNDLPVVEVPSEVRPATPQPEPAAPMTVLADRPLSEFNLTLPAPDLTSVLQEDKAARSSQKAGRRVGIRRSLPKPIQVSDGEGSAGWQVLPDGSRLWNGVVRSTGATGLRARFDAVQLPPDARIVLFDPDQPSQAVGPYDLRSVGEAGGFWSGTIFAERVAIECWLPPGTSAGLTRFRVVELTHRYVDVFAPNTEKLGPCHNDVTCFPAWASASHAVAGIGVVGSVGEVICTGTLIADNDPNTTLNYFLTAGHCIVHQVEADSSEFYWFYQSSVCDGLAPSAATVPRTSGPVDFLATMTDSQGNDFTLVRLRNDAAIPAGVTYAGWSTATPAAGTDLTVIHHPDGSHKRLSTGRLVGQTDNYWEVRWDSGSTEAGSSGAPLFDANQKLIGQLHGGDASCELATGTDTFGRFSVTYPIIERWLMNQPVVVPNDHFADASVITGPNGQLRTSTSGATRETNEPSHAGNSGGKSIWYRWTAPATGAFVFHTAGSGFDTLLAVYSGTALATLATVASNDDGGSASPASEVTFGATAGTEYFIAVDGYKGAAGPIALNWEPAAGGVGSNDLFANALSIDGSYGWVAASNVGASAEPLEPDHAGIQVGRSIWFRWTAPRTQILVLDTETSEIDTVLAVYTGSSLNALTVVADNDDIDFNNDIYTSRVTFSAVTGTTYYFAVDGYYDADSGITETGEILLNWYQFSDVAVPPANDAFTAAVVLTGADGTISASNDFATKEEGEPAVETNPGGASVWYRWTAPTSGLVTFSTEGSRFDTMVGVFRGAAVNALTLVGSADDISDRERTSLVTVPATAGAEYFIVVDGYHTESEVTRAGPYTLTWTLCSGCGGNDGFANAQVLVGGSGRTLGTNLDATKETGEPSIAGNTGGASIWYRWTAPASGQATFETTGSTFDTLLGVFTGSAVNALVMINANDDHGDLVQSRVSFDAIGGTEYRIAVAGYRFSSGTISQGSVVLSWSQPAGSVSQLAGARLGTDGMFEFSFTGIVGRSYEIERSADLITWAKVGTVLNTSGTGTFIDTDPVRDARFYRTKLAP